MHYKEGLLKPERFISGVTLTTNVCHLRHKLLQFHHIVPVVAEAITGLIYHRPSGENSNFHIVPV